MAAPTRWKRVGKAARKVWHIQENYTCQAKGTNGKVILSLYDKNYISHIFKDLNEVLGRQRSLILLLFLLQVNAAIRLLTAGIRGKSNNVINALIYLHLLQYLTYALT